MIKINLQRIIWFLILVLFAVSGNLYSQSSSFGNTYIFNNAEMGVVDIQHNFINGGLGIQPGLVGTDRTTTQGFISFVGSASWTGASNSAFVDGYVKTYMTTAFTFPIGDNSKYRPAAISTATLGNPANAAYYGVSASTAITSRLQGDNEPVLPASGPFNTTLMGTGVLSVNNVEYWDINGATSAKITLTWDATSAVTSLSSLGILGWNGTQWVAIASTVDSTSLLGGSSSLTSGSITTNAALVPDTYEIYTLGKVCGSGVAPTLSSTSLANICPALTVDLISAVTSSTPSGASLVWYTNTTHTGSAYATPSEAIAGTYYAFYYESENNCYTPGTTAVTATTASPPNTPTAASTSQPNCSIATGTIVITSQSGVEYSVNNGTSYQSSPTFAGLTPGNYTLKVRSTTSITCSAVGASTVTIINVPGTPTLSATNLINVCPLTTVNLNSIVTSSTPDEYSLVWFTNNAHTGTAYATPTAAIAGTYYGFYYNILNNCYTAATVAVTTSLDSDCDGIADLADIDDDNDGILDSVELGLCAYTLPSKTSITASSGLGWAGALSLVLDDSIADSLYSNPNAAPIAGANYLTFQFPSAIALSTIELAAHPTGILTAGSVLKVQGSNNGTTWVDLSSNISSGLTTGLISGATTAENFPFTSNFSAYTYYRLTGISGATINWYLREAYFKLAVPIFCDTDGDGVSNDKDLDSDGDGCPDAKEATVSGTLLAGNIVNGLPNATTTNVSNAISQGPYGTNGLANSLETNDTFTATTSYSSTYVKYAISSTLNGCADTDGDGIGDLVDLDDDNDGILDAIEAPSCYYTQAEISGISSVTSQLAASSYPTRTMWYDNNAATFSDFNPNISVVNQEIYNITPSTSPLVVSAVSFDITSYAILTAGSTAKLQGFDGTSWVDLSTAQSATVTSGTQTFTNTLQTTTAYQKFRLYGVTGTCYYGYCTEIRLIPSANSYGSAAPKATCLVDTDGDGKTNDKDLDSDGDLCPDAKEAGVTGTLLSGDIFNTSGTTSVNNATAQGPYGANGLANAIENNDTTSGITSYGSTYNPNATSTVLNACTDTDGDSTTDLVDIDDDNDGILDAVEAPSCYYTASELRVISAITTQLTPYSTNLVGNSYDNNVATYSAFSPSLDWVGKELYNITPVNPTPISGIELDLVNWAISNGSTNTFKLRGYNGSTWTDLSAPVASTGTTGTFTIPNTLQPNIVYQKYDIIGVVGTTYYGGVTEIRLVLPTTNQASTYPKAICLVDTDSDGKTNDKDLDSDGDLCPDAKEAGVTGTLLSGDIFNTSGTTSANNATAQGPYGANGLANAIETNDTTSGITSYVSTYNPNATSNVLNACTDTDGDSTTDLVDIDDDNDGILDAIEAPSCYYTQAEISGISSVTSQLAASSYPTRTMWYDNNAATFSDFNPNISVVNQEIYNITPSTSPLVVSAVSFDITSYAILTAGSTAKLQGFDGTSWVDLSTAQSATVTSGTQTFTNTLQTTTAYQKFRLYGVTGTCYYGYCTEIRLIPSANSYGSAAPKATCLVDTDGDGKTNDKDLDSDGDLCPDAKEAGVTGTLLSGDIFNTSGTTSASNAIAQGTYGANGLANSLETNDTVAATTNYTSTYQYAISSSLNACTDSDGDGIVDLADIDDDNDGVLDVVEQTCTSPTVSKAGMTASMTLTAGSGTISNLLNGTETTDFYYSSQNIAGQVVAQFIFPTSHILNKLEITTSGGNFFTSATVKVQGSNNGSSWTDVSGILTPVTPTASTFSTNSSHKFDISTNTNSYTQYRILGVSGSVNSGPWVYEAYFSELICVDINTDTDGIPNRLDLDSDYDGCSDAKEAGATTSNTTNFVFTGAVGANGLANSLETASESGIVNYTINYANVTNNAVKSCVITCPTVTNSVSNNVNPSTCTGSDGSIKLCGLASGASGFTINYSKNGSAATPLTNQTSDSSGCVLIPNLGAGIYSNIIITHSVYCTSGTTAVGPITITAPAGPSIPTVASTTQPTCAVPTGTIIFTTQSGVHYSVDNGLTYQASATFAGLTAGTYTLKVRSTSDASCTTAAASTVTIVPPSPTTAGTVSSNQAICSGSTPSDLTLSGNIGSVLKWQKSNDSAFTNPTDITSTSTTLASSVIGNLTTTSYFRAVVQNGTCTVENSNYVTITISTTTWDGSAWSNGPPVITTTAYMTGNYSEATNLFACTLTVSNNAIVSIPSGFDVTLNGKLTVDAGSSFTLNNNSNLFQQTDVSNTGDIIVKRMTTPIYRLDYTLWSSPVTGSQTLMDFSPLTSNIGPTNIRFYTYNTLTNQYNSVNPVTTTFAAAKGYLIRSPNNWISYNSNLSPAPQKWTGSFTGVPQNGNVTFTMANTGTNTAINATGNPYPSALLINNFINGNTNNIEGTLWFWRKFNDNNNLVSYSTCSTIGCTLNNNATYSDNNLISIGQGFMVKAKAGQTNLNFTNSMRSSENVDQFFKSSTTQMDRYWLKMTNSTNISAGQNLIAYTPTATYGYDSGLDGLYSNDSSVAFYSKADNQDVVINARPSFDVNDVIPMVFKSNVADTYTFSLNQKEGIFNGTQDVLLRDNYNNIVQNLTLGDYSFSTAVGTFTDRFDIIYQNLLSNTNTSLNANQILIYNKDQTTYINSGEITMDSIKIFDIQGRLLFQKSKINDTKISIKLDIANQVLLFQITTQNGEIITKKVIN